MQFTATSKINTFMIGLAWMILSSSPTSATTNEPIVGYKEVCPDVFEVDVLVDGKFIDTYLEPPVVQNDPSTLKTYECALNLHRD